VVSHFLILPKGEENAGKRNQTPVRRGGIMSGDLRSHPGRVAGALAAALVFAGLAFRSAPARASIGCTFSSGTVAVLRGSSRPALRRLLAFAATIGLAALVFADAPATAAVGCTFSGGTVTVTISAPNEAATIDRTAGGQIQVGGAPCPGSPTVTNTDKITVTGALGDQAARIDLANGGFAPGATAEGTGTSEIEFEIDLLAGNESTQGDIVSVSGTGAADTFRLGTLGVNLNGDNDADITGLSAGGATTTHVEVFELSGQGGPDVISGAASPDVGGAFTLATRLNGGLGSDQLTGGDGTDTLRGGPGDDTENGGNGPDLFNEEAAANGDDDFVGGGSPYDTLDYSQRALAVTVDLDGVADDGQPGAENDNAHSDIRIVYGSSGGDTITDNSGVFFGRTFYGGDGNDTITGGPAGDIIYGQGNHDTLHGGPQGDDLVGGEGNDDLFGDAGLDRFFEDVDVGGVSVTGPNGADDINGGSEEDFVSYDRRTTDLVVTAGDNLANDGADTTPGGAAEEGDNVHGDVEDVTGASSGLNRITGNALNNILAGGGLGDTIRGLGGLDDLIGDNGPDSLYGGAENDRLQGGNGNDQLFGEANDDTLIGSFDDDTLVGGPGNDNETGFSGDDVFLEDSSSNGNDTLDGQFDTDTVSYAGRSARVVVDLDGVADDGDPAAAEHDNVSASVENLIGGGGNDDLTGSTAPNVLRGNGGADKLVGLGGDDLLDGGLGTDDVEGDAGADTATYASRTTRVVASLDGVANDGDPTANGGTGEKDNVRADVENLTGGGGNDSLTGSDGVNVLHGGGGNDTLAGRLGDDDEYGDGGNDTFPEGAATNGADDFFGGADNGPATIGDLVTYNQRVTSIRVWIDDQPLDGADANNDGTGEEGDNVHTDVESARGGTKGDYLIGSAGPNQLFGLGANDFLDGGLGPDVLSGAGGSDTAVYTSRTSPLEVSLNSIANDGEAGELDNVLMDVENVWGGTSNDSFFGSTSANQFRGFLGDDFFDGSLGPDIFEGGGNYDTVDYSSRSIRVAVSIDGGANDGTDLDSNGVGEEGDNVLEDVEFVVGGSGDDLLVGSNDPDFIEGFWGKTGDDLLKGLGGQDIFRGGVGSDVMQGGDGVDRAFYDDHTAAVHVTLDDVANDGNPATPENDNVKIDIEDVVGGGGNDTIVGTNGPNKLYGGAGNDNLQGLDGDDELYGGDGSDFLDGAGGADLLQGDTGSDTTTYETYGDPVVVTLDATKNDGADTDADGDADEGDDVQVENVFGGSGNDHLSGDGLTNVLYGNGGNDTLEGWGGNDIFSGGDGADSEHGGDGDDLFAEDGASGSGGLPDAPDDIHGDGGSADVAAYGHRTQNLKINTGDDAANDGATDVAYTEGDNVHSDVEQVIGGAGNDDIQGSAGPNVLKGGDGNDILRDVDGANVMWGGAGGDAFVGGVGGDVAHGGTGADNFDGGPGNDTFDGADGADFGTGRQGNDTLDGGSGNDNLDGEDDSDEVNGGDGDDHLAGGSNNLLLNDSNDLVNGDAGNDQITGGFGLDVLNGGEGNDAINGQRSGDEISGGPDDDRISGGTNDIIDDCCEGPDVLNGDAGNDTIDGGLKNDSLFGGPGNDTLDGQKDCDLLDGGPGADSMDGGARGSPFPGVLCDAVTYASRTVPVVVMLDQIANDGGDPDGDGVSDEGDNAIRVVFVIGGPGDDSFVGDSDSNAFCGGGGSDSLDGGAGDDGLVGGPGGDTLLGSDGNDQLGKVNAAIVPGGGCPTSDPGHNDPGQDTMQGQAGDDTFTADDGEIDHLFGGAGTDGGTWDPSDVRSGIEG
jgi:Ca2+-binding RTX toxin-like protein